MLVQSMLRVVCVILFTGFVGTFAATRSEACSICQAGDPRFDAHGANSQDLGSFSVFLEVRGWEKESGLLPHEEEEEAGAEHHEGRERNESQRLDLYLSYTPIDRLTLTLDLPWHYNEVTEIEEGERHTSKLNDFGDMSLSATGVLWRNRKVLPSTWVEGRFFMKMPTGKSRQRVDGVRDPHLQAGTGSWDMGLGLAAVHKVEWGFLYSSFFYRVNTEGSLDYEYGDVILANAAVDVPVGHAVGTSALDWLTMSLQLNYRWAEKDESEGLAYDDSGGSILYVSPGVSITVPWLVGKQAPKLRSAVQIPITSTWLNGTQHEDPIWSAGILLNF